MDAVWEGVVLIGSRIVLPVGVFLVALVGILFLVGRLMKCLHAAELPVLVVFCLLGAVIGIFTGNSRSPVVAGLLPAILTFATAMVAYFATTKESMKAWRRQIPLHMIGLLVAVGVTAFYGAYLRGLSDRQEAVQKRELLQYEKVQLEIEKEQALQLIRANTPAAAPAREAPKAGR